MEEEIKEDLPGLWNELQMYSNIRQSHLIKERKQNAFADPLPSLLSCSHLSSVRDSKEMQMPTKLIAINLSNTGVGCSDAFFVNTLIVICCSTVDLPTCSLAVELQFETESWRHVRRRMRWSALRYRRLSHSLSLPLTYNNPRPSSHTHISPFTSISFSHHPLYSSFCFHPSPFLFLCSFNVLSLQIYFTLCVFSHRSTHHSPPPSSPFPLVFLCQTRFQSAQLRLYICPSRSLDIFRGFTSIHP